MHSNYSPAVPNAKSSYFSMYFPPWVKYASMALATNIKMIFKSSSLVPGSKLNSISTFTFHRYLQLHRSKKNSFPTPPLHTHTKPNCSDFCICIIPGIIPASADKARKVWVLLNRWKLGGTYKLRVRERELWLLFHRKPSQKKMVVRLLFLQSMLI